MKISWIGSIFKFVIAGVLTWTVPAIIWLWNGKDDTRSFILEAVEPRFKEVQVKHDNDIAIISTQLTPIGQDVRIIKKCLISGCHNKR